MKHALIRPERQLDRVGFILQYDVSPQDFNLSDNQRTHMYWSHYCPHGKTTHRLQSFAQLSFEAFEWKGHAIAHRAGPDWKRAARSRSQSWTVMWTETFAQETASLCNWWIHTCFFDVNRLNICAGDFLAKTQRAKCVLSLSTLLPNFSWVNFCVALQCHPKLRLIEIPQIYSSRHMLKENHYRNIVSLSKEV